MTTYWLEGDKKGSFNQSFDLGNANPPPDYLNYSNINGSNLTENSLANVES